MVLPEQFDLQFERALRALEEAEKMKYVTTIERRAIEQGIEQGRLQTLREMLIEGPRLRFQELPDELLGVPFKPSDLQQLKQLNRQAIIAGSLEEFEHMLEAEDQG